MHYLSGSRTFAFPLSAYVRGHPDKDAAFIRKVLPKGKVAGIAVGLPVRPINEQYNVLCDAFRAYIAELFSEGRLDDLGITTISFWDEAYSSAEAREYLPFDLSKKMKRKVHGRKHAVDQVSITPLVHLSLLRSTLEVTRCFQRRTETGQRSFEHTTDSFLFTAGCIYNPTGCAGCHPC